MAVDAVLAARVGAVVAPAGCGKTQLIVSTLANSVGKPVLVLTHTTAGVAALKNRLADIPSKRYRVSTIAGWALVLAKKFPGISGYAIPETGPPNYPALQQSIATLLNGGALSDALSATYSRVLVDEYQDCDERQHSIVCALANTLPVVIFGDPMQAIFGFAGPLPDWSGSVISRFPVIAKLDTPWRWSNAGSPELGEWILAARNSLLAGQKIDLGSCPNHVSWIALTTDARENLQTQVSTQYQVRQTMEAEEKLLIIGSSKDAASRHRFARSASGVEAVEPVDLKDIVAACDRIDQQAGVALLETLTEIASSLMTGVDKANLRSRANTIAEGRNRTPPTPIEQVAAFVVQNGSVSASYELLKLLAVKTGARIFRRDAYYALCESLQYSIANPGLSLKKSAANVRERRRHRGDKRIPSRAIGSTLLLKGLEAEHVVILDAHQLTPHDLYVALSRGSKSLTVFSRTQYVG